MLMSKLRSMGIMTEAAQLVDMGMGESHTPLILDRVGVGLERAHCVSSILHFKASTAKNGAQRSKYVSDIG